MSVHDQLFEEFELRCLEAAARFNEMRSPFSQMAAYQRLILLKKSNADSFRKVLAKHPDVNHLMIAINSALDDPQGVEDMMDI